MRRALKPALIAAFILIAGILLKGSIPQPPTGSWLSFGAMTDARSGAASALLQDGRILITGGDNGSGPLASTEVLDTTGAFVAAPPMNNPRSKHIAVVLQDGRVLVAGGLTTGGSATNSAEIFDPASNSWTSVSLGMGEARSDPTAAVFQDGRVVIAGGQNGATVSSTIEIFDPSAGTFAFAGLMSSPRSQFAMTVLQDGRVLIVGGNNGTAPAASTDVFDPAAGAVSAGPSLSVARFGHSATTLLNGQVVVIGGNNGNADPAQMDVTPAELIDFTAITPAFTTLPASLATPREGHLAFLLPNNNNVVIVGGTSAGVTIASAELFSQWQGTFAATGTMTAARSNFTGSANQSNAPTSVMQRNGFLLAAGGSDANGNALNTAEAYGYATVQTDHSDYAPGSVVTITGSGWQPGETVSLTLVESPFYDSHGPFTTVADSSGNISNNQFSPDEHDLSIHFYLTAVGSVSGIQAQNTFTDSKASTVTVASPTSATVAPGGTAAYGTVTVTFNGSPGTCNATLGATGLPTGANPVFGTNPVVSTGSVTSTFSVTTTAATTPGLATINVTAKDGAGCQDTNTVSSSNVTLVVQEPTTTTLASSVNPTVFGQSTTLTATVAQTAGTTVPTGTVTFKDGATALGTGTLNGSGVATLNISTLTAGSHNLTASYAGVTNTFGASSSNTVTQTVNQATPTITFGAAPTPIYLGGNFTVSATTTNTDSATLTYSRVSGPCALVSGATFSSSGAGVCVVQASGAATANFQAASNTQSVTIAKATTTLSVTNSPVTYNGSAQAAAVSGSVPGTVSNVKYNGSATVPTNAGTYAITADFAPTDTTNYNSLTAASAGNFVINKGTATLSVTNSPVTYNVAPQAASVTGSVAGTVSNVKYNGSATVPTNANTYAITADFTPTDTTNYSSLSAASAGNFVINKATPTLSVTNSPVTYNATPQAATVTGSVAGTVNNIKYGGSATAPTNAGTYAITADFTPTDTTNYNNLSAASAGNFVINKATPTLSVTNSPVTYNATPQAATVTGSVAGTVNNIKYGGSATAPTNAGTYAITADFTPTDTTNYNNLSAASAGNFVINKATPTLSVTNSPVTYNATPQAASVSGSVSGAVSNVKYNGSATVPTNAGTYAITADFTPADATNYSVLSGASAGNFVITQATPAVTVSGGPFTYDGNQHAATGTATGIGGAIVAGTFAFTYTPPGNSTAPTNAGTYTVGASFTSTDQNYVNASGSGSITIDKAMPVFSPALSSPAAIPFGRATVSLPPVSVMVVSGGIRAASPDTVTITINGASSAAIPFNGSSGTFGPTNFDTHAIPVGSYAITYSYSGGTNFKSITDSNTTLTVTKVTPIVTWATPATITFNTALSATQLNATFTAIVNGASVPVAGTPTYNPAAGTILNAGAGQTLSVNFAPTDTTDYNNASGSVLITVNKAITSTAVTSNNNPSFSGQSITFTATVSNTSGTSAVPTGSVQFMDGASPLGTPQPLVAGKATLTTSALTVAIHSITAVYTNSDGNFAGSTSAAFSQTVKSADTTTSISAPAITFGANGLVTVAVAAVDPSAGTPTGNVSLSVDGGAAVSQALTNGSTIFTVSTPGGGSHSLSASYAAQNNFNSSGATGSLQVNQAAQSITITTHAPGNAAYGASFGVAATATSGLAVAITTSGSCGGSGTSSATITMSSGTGTCVVHYNQPGNTNYTAASEATDSATATQLTPTVTVTDPMPTFDGTPKMATAVATGLNNAAVNGSFSFTYDGSSAAPSNAKTSYAVVATFISTDPNYTGATGVGTLTIKPAAATASVIDTNPTYDGTPKFPTVTTNPMGLTIAVTYSLSGNPLVSPTLAGVYSVTVMITDSNYTGGGSGTLTIKPAQLTLTAADASRPYAQTNPTFAGTLTGVIAGDGITASYASAATSATAAGVYGPNDVNAIIPTLNDPNNKLSNYQVTSTNGTLTITAVPLYVIANDKTRAFGAGDPAFDAQYIGLVNGDQPNSLGTLTCASANAGASAGTYAIHCGGLTSSDYAIYFVDGTLTVTDPLSTIAVSPNPAPVTYGSMQTFTAQGTFASAMMRNLANAGGMSYMLHDMLTTRSGAAAAEAGGKLYAIGGLVNGDMTTPSATVEVYNPMNEAAGWTAVANLGSARTNSRAASLAGKVYVFGCIDATCTSMPGTAEVYDPISNKWSAISSTGFTARSNAPAIPLNGKIYVAGGNDGNGMPLKTVEIYDPGTDSWSSGPSLASAAGPASGGVVNGMPYLVSMSGGNAIVQKFDGTNWTIVNSTEAVGDAAAAVLNNVIYVIDGSSVHAYDPAQNTWTDKASLSTARLQPEPVAIGNLIYVAGNGAGGQQSAALEAFAVDEASWASSDTTIASIDQSGKASALKVGSSTITATSLIFPAISGSALMTVGPVTVTPVVAVNDKKYDGLKSAAIANETLTGVRSGDETFVSLTGGTATFDTKDVGTGKTVTVTGLSLSGSKMDDYVLSSTTATTTATIMPVSVQVTASSATVTYGDAVPTITPSYSGFISGEDQNNADGFAAPTCVTNYTNTSNAGGSYYTRCSAAAATNYKFTYVDGSVKVLKATPTVTVSFASSPITYDGNSHPATATVTGVGGADLTGHGTVSVTYTPPGSVAAPLNAGNYSASAHFTSSDGNYTDADSTVAASQVIKKAVATIVVTPYNVTYDGNPHTATGTATGVKGEALVGLGLSGTTHTNAGTTTDSWTFTDVTGNYYNASSTVSDVIKKANATISVTPYNVTYDGNPHTATGTAKGVLGETLAGLDLSGTTHTNAGTTTDTWTFTDVSGNYYNATATVSDIISQAPSTTTVSCPASVIYNGLAQIPCTASVTGAGALSQSLSVSYGNNTSAGTATANATFAGDINHTGSSDSKTFTINPAPSTTLVTFEVGPYTYRGTQFVAMAAVSGAGNLNAPVAVGYTGDCVNVTIAGCTATAIFGGDNNHTGSADTKTIIIAPASTTTTVVSSPNPSDWSQVVTLTATVVNTSTGAAPTGSVSFYNAASGANCALLGTSTQLDVEPLITVGGNVQATTSTPNLPVGPGNTVGTDNILACFNSNTTDPIFNPNPNDFMSSNGALAQTVNPAPIVTLAQTSLSFGLQPGGTTSGAKPVTVCNGPSGVAGSDCSNAPISTAALSIASIGFTNSNTSPVYFSQTNTCSATLAVGGTCVISVKFAPPAGASGLASAYVTLTDNNRNVPGSMQSASLTGSGTSSISGVGSLSTYALFATATGCSSVSVSGNGTVDSYNGLTDIGNVGTNGNAILSGNPVVNGAIYSPVAGPGNCSSKGMTGLSTSGKAQATGGLKALPGPVNYPLPPAPSPAPPTTTQNISGSCGTVAGCTTAPGSKSVNLASGSYGNLSATGGTTLHLLAGTYNFNSLTLSGNSILYVDSGPVVINLAGASLSASGAALDLSGGSIVNPSAVTSNLQFYYAGSKAFKVSGGTGSYAMVYAPNAAINISGGANFYGSIIGSTINSSGNTAVHYDAAETAINMGQTIWFNSGGLNVQGLPNTGSVKLYITNAMITFTANGNAYSLAVPNAVITFSSSVSSASTTWDATNNRWSTLIPLSSVKGNATVHSFFDGLAYLVPSGGFPGGIQNVTWQAAYSTSTPGLNFNWQWGAAVYNQFPANTTGSAFPPVTTGDYNQAHVNALDNADPAGTPESQKTNLAFGDMGAGYTGLYAGTTAVVPTIAPLSFSQSSLDFGTVPQGSQSTQLTATLTNNDSVPYTINAMNGIQYTGTFAGDFTIANNCPISPNSLAAGGSCTFTVTLTPSAPTSGTKETAKIVVNDNANNSPQTVFLKGTVQ